MARKPLPQEAFDKVLAHISAGLSIRTACSQPGCAKWDAFRARVDADPDMAARYARAMEMRADALFEEAIQIANTPIAGDIIEMDGEGNITRITRKDQLEHRRLQIETRKWAAGKLSPAKYSDKVKADLSGTITVNLPDITDRL